ncbi:VirB3 family type IV secretion system protein [Paralcaligenes sp. KSB-10]|uniref:VirB3 family type IV secretion system protein n=1 Tax=Paralcaligenes sp. KSB-10 TaxID=2901142 RepID=UPI00351CB813
MAANSYPVFKGLGRKATFMGIPTTLLLGAFACVAIIAMMAGLYSLCPRWAGMWPWRGISRLRG